MINIIAPPGCYGTYIARCLHHYTTVDDSYILDFDQHGSSHAFREINSDVQKTRIIHWQDQSIASINKTTTVVITGDQNHNLDYYDNQFYKNAQGNLVDYLLDNAGAESIGQRLKQGWAYDADINCKIPRWILREYCSFWMTSAWEHGYSTDKYMSLPHVYNFCCEELWSTDMWHLVNNLAEVLNQKMYAPERLVQKNHQAFLKCQQYHDMQLRCQQFVYDTINVVDSCSPCISVFDEAYVQHLLRQQQYEIQCQNLDQFPATSTQLTKIIYETSNHSNP